MNSQYKQRLLKLIDDTIAVGEELDAMDRGEDSARKSGLWVGKVYTLIHVMGDQIEVWRNGLFNGVTGHQIGTLRAIKYAVENDWLTSVENFVVAEAFNDLLEQADYLLEKSFHVAAGTLGRAVLEEHLRKWCSRVNCFPTKPKPTITDFKTELYKNGRLDKVTQMHVESMAAIGNQAAHNL